MNDIEEPLAPESLEETEPTVVEEKNKEENYRLAGRPPLKTLLILGIGPFISQMVSGMYGVVASMWVAKAMGEQGMAAISLYTNLDNVGRAFGFFMNCAASQKISSLFGEKKGGEAGQVICDLLRCCVLCGMVVPALLLPVAKPLGKWFGADEETYHMGFLYLVPLLGCSTITCFYLMMCGALQAEGRTMLVSVAQISSFVLNMAVFCPLFLLGLRLGTIGAGLATVCSDLCPTIFMLVFYFRGKFGVKPKLSGLFKKFSPHTWPALSVGVSQLAANVSRSLPSILQRKFMGLASEKNPDADFNDTMSGFTAVIRVYGITDSVRFAISMSLLPTASYANSAQLFTRFWYLIFHAIWLSLVWGLTTMTVTAFAAKYVAMIISKSEAYLKMAAPMIRTANWEAPFAWGRFVCQTILQSLGCGKLATIYSIIATFFANIAAYCLIYYTDKTNVIRLMWSYSCSSAIAFIVGIFILIIPFKQILKKSKEGGPIELEEQEQEQINDSQEKQINFVDKEVDPIKESEKESNDL